MTDKYAFSPEQLKFIDALESGKYRQTRTVLRNDLSNGPPCFCALGVACEEFKDVCGLEETRHGYNHMTGALPQSVKDILRLTDNGIGLLTSKNDVSGYSFVELATMLKTEPSKFFETEPRFFITRKAPGYAHIEYAGTYSGIATKDDVIKKFASRYPFGYRGAFCYDGRWGIVEYTD